MSKRVLEKIKKLMKIGVVTDSDYSISYPVVITSFLGKTLARAVNFTPFGLWSRPTEGMMSMIFNVNGSESNGFALTNELKNRPVTNLEKGEVVLGNLLSYFYFKEDGSVSLFVNGAEVITIDTDTNIAINGNLSIDGDLTNTGDITSDGTVEGAELTNGLVPYSTHVHSDPQGGITGVPQ